MCLGEETHAPKKIDQIVEEFVRIHQLAIAAANLTNKLRVKADLIRLLSKPEALLALFLLYAPRENSPGAALELLKRHYP